MTVCTPQQLVTNNFISITLLICSPITLCPYVPGAIYPCSPGTLDTCRSGILGPRSPDA